MILLETLPVPTARRPHAVLALDGEMASVCAWCPDKREADAWCCARGIHASHTICRTCQARFAFSVAAND